MNKTSNGTGSVVAPINHRFLGNMLRNVNSHNRREVCHFLYVHIYIYIYID